MPHNSTARARYGQQPPLHIELAATVQRVALRALADWRDQHNLVLLGRARIDGLPDWPPILAYRRREEPQ